MNNSKYVYPEQIEIQPISGINKRLRLPGSKSLTNRAMVIGALASRDIQRVDILGTSMSDDTVVMASALKKLGYRLQISPVGALITFSSPGTPEIVPSVSADLHVGNSGTTMRFLAALVALGCGEYRLSGDPRMHERPIGDLLDGLRQLGIDAICERNNECPPVVIRALGIRGGHARIDGSKSSQFVSALLLAAPYAQRETILEITGSPTSLPYISMTVKMMRECGVGLTQPDPHVFRIPANQAYVTNKINIEPDATSASYFFAAAAIADGAFVALDLPLESAQGDIDFVRELKHMGCLFAIADKTSTLVASTGKLRGISVDMNAISDTVMTLAAVACFAEGPTTIRNVAHIRHKECDRITALCTELRKLGVEVEEYPDGLKITPRPMHGAVIETYNDHRMAMSMALIGLKVPGVVIKNPGCVAKTYPGFWEDWKKLYE